MTMYKEIIHNIATGEITERPYTQAEIANVKAEEARVKTECDLSVQKEAEKAALLAKLGITADEAKLLLS